MVLLKKKTLGEAIQLLYETLDGLQIEVGSELVETIHSLSRITTSPLRAKYPVPSYRASAMDGIALKAADTFLATRNKPKSFSLQEILPVNTGDPVPKEYDAVIKIEDTRQGKDLYQVFTPATPYQHIRPIGEDMEEGKVILPKNHLIRAADLGALLAAGLTEIAVKRKPPVAIVATGSELISPGKRPLPGEVVEFNSQIIKNLVSFWGGEGIIVKKIKDDPLMLKEGLFELSKEYPLLVTIAGSSAGSEDFIAPVVQGLGDLIFHGVSIRPGKPVILGRINSSILLGLPGYPVSCYLAAHLFLRRILYQLQDLPLPPVEKVEAILNQDVLSSYGVDEFIRVSLGRVQEEMVAQPLPRGASILSSLVEGDGFLRIKRLSRGAMAREKVKIEISFRSSPIKRFFVAGSHHPLLTVLKELLLTSPKASYLMLGGKRRGLTGLLTLKEGLSHLAALNLPWDPVSHSLTLATSNQILEILGQQRAYFLPLTTLEGEEVSYPPFVEALEDHSYGLLFLCPQEIGEIMEAVKGDSFKALVLKNGFCNKMTGTLYQLEGKRDA